MISIVQDGDPVLRAQAQEVPLSDISSPKIKKIIEHMQQALSEQEDGVAIAAPQIGESLRIFVVSGKVLVPNYPETKSEDNIPSDLICINPKIVKRSKKKATMTEGCLSVRWLYGDIKRSTHVTIEAYNEKGEQFTRGASGLLAQIFQHEYDHLDGILFIDSATNIEDLPPEKDKK